MRLSAPQNVFLNQLNTKYRAYVGGFGSGKTFVGCLDLAIFAGRHPKTVQGYFGPTYPSIRDIFYPTMDEAASLMGYHVKINESNKELHLYRGRWYYGTVICRSMEKPNSIVGFKIARALVDEIDTLPMQKAKNAWAKIIARLRLKIDGVVNGIGVTTTPEGFLFVYDTFYKTPGADYSMVQASTYENADYLPDDYIQSLLDSYPEQLVRAYLLGDFVNLASGRVYPEFDRHLNAHHMTITDADKQLGTKAALHVGMDFNVNKMAAAVFVILEGQPYGVGEIVKGRDTPSMADQLKTRYPDRRIVIYPDASGQNRTTKNSSTSDHAILEAAGFVVDSPDANPLVRDRVNAVNGKVLSASGDRTLLLNEELMPETVASLEQQAYTDAGEPDKSKDTDHSSDAVGYFIHRRWPLDRPLLHVGSMT
jgi:hypothetical protein